MQSFVFLHCLHFVTNEPYCHLVDLRIYALLNGHRTQMPSLTMLAKENQNHP